MSYLLTTTRSGLAVHEYKRCQRHQTTDQRCINTVPSHDPCRPGIVERKNSQGTHVHTYNGRTTHHIHVLKYSAVELYIYS